MPYLGSTLFVATVVVLLLASLAGALLLCLALFGSLVERSARACEERPRSSLAVGIPLTALGTLAPAALLQGGGGARALGVVLAAAMFGALVLGLAAMSLRVGAALWSRYDVDRPYRRLLRGAVVVELAAAMPLFGWFFVLPLTVAMGVGALVVGRFVRAASTAREDRPWGGMLRAPSH